MWAWKLSAEMLRAREHYQPVVVENGEGGSCSQESDFSLVQSRTWKGPDAIILE